MVGYLSQKGFTITLDGTTKTIMGPTEEELKAKAGGDNWTEQDYIDLLSEKINKSFGEGKLTVTNGSSSDNMIALQFSVAGDSGSTFLVKSSAGEQAGISGSLSNYVDTSVSCLRNI
jgi:hypothetical protein